MVTIAQCLKEMGNFPDLGMSWSGIGEETYTVRAIIPGSAFALMIWKDGDKPSLFGARMPY